MRNNCTSLIVITKNEIVRTWLINFQVRIIRASIGISDSYVVLPIVEASNNGVIAGIHDDILVDESPLVSVGRSASYCRRHRDRVTTY